MICLLKHRNRCLDNLNMFLICLRLMFFSHYKEIFKNPFILQVQINLQFNAAACLLKKCVLDSVINERNLKKALTSRCEATLQIIVSVSAYYSLLLAGSCPMSLWMFPFDQPHCAIILQSYSFNAQQVIKSIFSIFICRLSHNTYSPNKPKKSSHSKKETFSSFDE